MINIKITDPSIISHYGVSVKDGAPGRGSGRYPLGSGERPRSESAYSNECRKTYKHILESDFDRNTIHREISKLYSPLKKFNRSNGDDKATDRQYSATILASDVLRTMYNTSEKRDKLRERMRDQYGTVSGEYKLLTTRITDRVDAKEFIDYNTSGGLALCADFISNGHSANDFINLVETTSKILEDAKSHGVTSPLKNDRELLYYSLMISHLGKYSPVPYKEFAKTCEEAVNSTK